MTDTAEDLPKIIWFLWFQGLGNAPYVVRKCYESWTILNPGWKVVYLDEESVRQFTAVDYASGNLARLMPQHRSGLLRFDLLAHYGGVWVDATTLCTRPLDDWLPSNLQSGFFAFHKPGPDRIISTWFLAAAPGNTLVSRLFERMIEYWTSHPIRHIHERTFPLERFFLKALNRLLAGSPRRRGWWFAHPVRNWLAAYPYFAHAYGLEKLVNDDPECAHIWSQTPKITADGPHHLQTAGLLSAVPAWLQSEIDKRQVPIYKTCWRTVGERPIPSDSCLGYALETLGI